MGLGVLLAGGVRRLGGEICQSVHVHGIAHRGGKVGLKIKIQPVAAGAVRIQDGQRHGGGPLQVVVVFQLLHHLVQPLLHVLVVVGEALFLNVLRHQLQGLQPAAQVSLGQVHLPLAALSHHVAGGEAPVGAGGLLLGGEGLGAQHHRDGNERGQCQQHGPAKDQPFPFSFDTHSYPPALQ